MVLRVWVGGGGWGVQTYACGRSDDGGDGVVAVAPRRIIPNIFVLFRDVPGLILQAVILFC